MGLKNKEKWEEYLGLNPNGYGGVICAVAERTMEKLDELTEPLKQGYFPDITTPQGLIRQSAEETIDMAKFSDMLVKQVETIIFDCHERGEEFRRVYEAIG
jgi:hypothetical protein